MNSRQGVARARHLILFVVFLMAASCGREGRKTTDLESLLRAGQEQMQEARYREAVGIFEKASRLYPHAPEPYLRLALLYEECLPDPATALRYYRKYQQAEKDPVKRDEVGGWIRQLEQRVAKAAGGDVKVSRLSQVGDAGVMPRVEFPAGGGSPGSRQETAELELRDGLDKAPQQLEDVKSLRIPEGEILEKLAAAERTVEQMRAENESLTSELRSARLRIAEFESGEKDRQIARLVTELQEARRALESAEAGKAKADAEIAELNKAAATYAATLSSLQRDYDRLKGGAATPRAAPPTHVKQARTRTIRAGETLKSIAASPSVYGDSGKWILLYQANKEKIRNPNRLTPGQILVVPPD